MKTLCGVESGNYCSNTSSCSMILRSACSHRHSHKSVVVNEVQAQGDTHKKRKQKKASSGKLSSTDSSNNSIQLDTVLGSSLKKLALTSTKTFSVFKENLHNHLEISRNCKSHLVERNGQESQFIKKFHLCETSTPIYSSSVNDITDLKDFNKNTSLQENNSSVVNALMMSRTRSLQRSNLRAVSGSEDEEESVYRQNKVKLKRTRNSVTVSRFNSTGRSFAADSDANNIHYSSNHLISSENDSASAVRGGSAVSITKPNDTPTGIVFLNQRAFSSASPQVDTSIVQCSTFDRLRWLLWRYLYLKIIACVNFDVWLLSRLHNKKLKAIVIFLLPLLIYLLYNSPYQDVGILYKPFDFIYSMFLALASSFYSFVSSFFIGSKEMVFDEFTSFSCPGLSDLFPLLGSVFKPFSSFFVRSGESASFVHKASFQSSASVDEKPVKAEIKIANPSREEMRSVAAEVLEERLNHLMTNFYESDKYKTKGETIKLQNEIKDLQFQFKSLSGLLRQLETDFHMEKMERSAEKTVEHNAHFKLLNEKMKAFEIKLESLGAVKKCCDEKISPSQFAATVESYIVDAFKSVINRDENSNSPYYFFSEWLNSKINDPTKLSSEVNLAFEKLKTQLKPESRNDKESLKVIEGIVQHYVESLKRNLTFLGNAGSHTYDSLSLQDMRKIAKEAIMLYDADKTGLVDYALESAGGSVLGTRCSESYVEKTGRFSVFGLPLWSDENSPRTAIQPNVSPGECWAFKGSQGFLVIQLSYTIYPTGFTLEHIPVSLSPTGSIDSAPRDFSVWGLDSESDNEGTLLGKYFYNQDGEPLQYFPVQNLTAKSFSYVELKIHSNHGNLEYTCLYRFRVHGTRMK